MKAILPVTSALFVVIAPFVLLIRWNDYTGIRWSDFNVRQLIIDMIILFVVLLIIGLLFVGDDSPPYDDFDPQDGGRWIH